MRTELPQDFLDSADGRRADAILRSCVHCGFCNATCPTYQLTGDELDGPRGRIYLMKGMFETGQAGATIQLHLDRCLTCRACETTCPSGVAYGELVEIGRNIVEQKVSRRPIDRLLRKGLRWLVPHAGRFRAGLDLGRLLRGVLPARLSHYLAAPGDGAAVMAGTHERRVILLNGCVQRSLTPEVNRHLVRLLDARGVQAVTVDDEACCGSLALHLGHPGEAHVTMRANIAALARDRGNAEAIISTATGCGVTVKDYGRLFATDADAGRADDIARLACDAVEYLEQFSFAKRADIDRVAFQSPCTLQHGQRLDGRIEALLQKTGYTLTPVADGHLCCGSAGSYALLQPTMAGELRERKLAALSAGKPQVIATANVGCHVHLRGGSSVPVMHWIELLI